MEWSLLNRPGMERPPLPHTGLTLACAFKCSSKMLKWDPITWMWTFFFLILGVNWHSRRCLFMIGSPKNPVNSRYEQSLCYDHMILTPCSMSWAFLTFDTNIMNNLAHHLTLFTSAHMPQCKHRYVRCARSALNIVGRYSCLCYVGVQKCSLFPQNSAAFSKTFACI